MASEDVIELGSSDDEPAEPAPKKVKPLPNTMVQFPTTSTNLLTPRKVLTKPIKVKQVLIKNSPLKPNPFAAMRPIKFHDSVMKAGVIQAVHTSMPKVAKIYAKKAPCVIQKNNISKLAMPHIPIVKPQGFKKVQNQKCLTKLPPGIIVTRTTGEAKKRARPDLPAITIKKRKLAPKISNVTEVLTVDLDDDETTESSRPHPAWCLKPIEQKAQAQQNILEVMNNKEPEPTRSIEIVIEDSPIKPPIINVHSSEIGRVLEITIDDSPIKVSSELNKNNEQAKSGSDEEKKKRKVPQSKKKLDYPKETATGKLSGLTNITMEVPIETDLQDSACETGMAKSSTTNVTHSVSKNPETNVKHSVTKTPETNIKHSVSKNHETNVKHSVSKNPETNIKHSVSKSPEANVKHSVSKIPETNVTHSVSKNTETNVTHSVSKNPETNVKHSVSKHPETNVKHSVSKHPETNVKHSVSKNPETNVKHVVLKNPDKQSVNKLRSSESIIIEINSPVKQLTEIITTTDTDENEVDNVKAPAIASVPLNIDIKTKNSEFNDVYQSFIDLCFKVENTEDMKKIVEKKIKAYYREVPKEYTESAEFIEMVASKVAAINADPDRMYLYIKDIVDELNLQRKITKTKINTKEKPKVEVIQPQDVEDPVRYRQICKLEKTLRKLHRAIQKLEEQEVDFDEEAESVYLLTESEEGNSSKDSDISPETDKNTLLQRYKERLVRVHAKICKLTNTKMPSEPHVHIDARPGRPKGPVQCLERWINKKVPIGTPLPFPDFHDVIKCVREANETDKLGWTELEIMDEARDLFMRCGKKLQRRRQENEWRVASTIISGEIDPAESSSELKKQLNQNKVLAASRESEVINKYADRQNILKLEAKEIGDKEAEQSPVESDNEISDDDVDPKNTHHEIADDGTSLKNELTKVSDNNKKIVEVNKKPVDVIKPQELSDEIDNNDDKENNVILVEENSQVLKTSNKGNDPNCNKQENEQILDKINPINQLTEIIKLDNEETTLNPVGMSAKNNPIKCTISTKDKGRRNYDDTTDVGEPSKITKLYSDSDINLTNDSSESDGLVAVSDLTKTSLLVARDVVTIDNSSCSESDENRRDKCDKAEFLDKTTKKSFDLNMDMSSPIRDNETVFEYRIPTTMNEEYTDSIENILLASDDDSSPQVNVVGSIPAEIENLKQAVMTRQDKILKKYDYPANTKTQNETKNSDVRLAADVGSSVVDVVNDLMKDVIYGNENDTRANEKKAVEKDSDDVDDDDVDKKSEMSAMPPELIIETAAEKCDKKLSTTDLEESLQRMADEVEDNEMETDSVEAKESAFGFPSNVINDVDPVETTISRVGDKQVAILNSESQSSNETVNKEDNCNTM